MEQVEKEKRVLQWHPAFVAGLLIEFEGEEEKLLFESEYQLGTKPKEIDVLIIKRDADEPIEKNIGRIFRKHNIVEYKSPEDYLSVDDFYKVYGYACFYKSDAKLENGIPADEITISFVCKGYPYKLVKHLRKKRDLEIVRFDRGIYYITGDIIAMQLIVTSRLSKKQNFWLSNLTNDIKEPERVQEVAAEYQKHRGNKLYRAVMNIIVQANMERFKEGKDMCEAIIELFQDEYDRGIKAAREEALLEGRMEGRMEGRLEGLRTLADLVRDNLLSLDEAVKRAKISKEEFLKLC